MMKFGANIPITEYKAAGDHWIVEGYVSTYNNVDEGYDVVVPGAFTRWLSSGRKTQFLRSHHPDKVLGVFLDINDDQKGLHVKGKISKTALGEETYTLLKDGALDSWSIGYVTINADKKDGLRYLKDLNLPESSLVSMAMNPEAMVTNVKDYLSAIGVTPDMTMAEKAAALSEQLNQLLTDTRSLTEKKRPLSETKRQELLSLLETFSSLDAVRSDLTTILDVAPINVSGKRVMWELSQRRRKLAHLLT